MSNLILVDVDGVLLDWLPSFERWMASLGYIRQNDSDDYNLSKRYNTSNTLMLSLISTFNESIEISRLSPFKDSVEFVEKLHWDYGYVFHAITSLSKNKNAQKMRKKNLEDIFGKNVFVDFTFFDVNESKESILKKFSGSNLFWIEDSPENADAGIEFGLKSILMNHSHNQNYDGKAINVNNWGEIFNLITKKVI